MKLAMVVIGCQFGDEAKGQTVEFLCRKHKANLVVRYSGGSQCGHNVELPDGRRHCYSQFGAGSHLGIPTYLGPSVIINPPAMQRERIGFVKTFGADPSHQLYIDPNCLVTTYYHIMVNQFAELTRGDNRHGSCGHGIGETRGYWLEHGIDAIRARDLIGPRELLHWKLLLLRERMNDQQCDWPLDSVESVMEKLTLPSDICIRVPDWDRFDTVVCEGAQGLLLDETIGFAPYNTWSDVTPRPAFELLPHEYEKRVIGCMRPYMTRHGAGPFPTEDKNFLPKIIDHGNCHNEWQGTPRYGCLDLVLLKYAKRAMYIAIDEVALNCCDHVIGMVAVCTDYTWGGVQWCPQFLNEKNTCHLSTVRPALKWMAQDELREWIGEHIAPVTIEGHGPTFEHRKEI